MSQKHRLAAKLRWSKLSPEEKTIRARNTALKKWANISPKERTAHAQKMLLAKKNKK